MLGGSGGMLPRKILKNWMHFPAFRDVLGPTIEAVMKSVLSVICPGKILHPRF